MPAHLFTPADHGAEFGALLAEPRLAPLDAGTPNRAVQARLAALTPEKAFAPHVIVDHDMARACLASIWLHHDFLDESHAISQEIRTPTGSYWHAILHRREPDASNSAYWFRRVGEHAIFADLASEAAQLGYHSSEARWNPFAFIDECEGHRGKGDETEGLLRRVQRAEWELLFDYSY